MFDYQAGEKYRLTLIMVGFVGVMMGIFFSTMVLQPSEPPHRMAAKGERRGPKRHQMYNEHGDPVDDPRMGPQDGEEGFPTARGPQPDTTAGATASAGAANAQEQGQSQISPDFAPTDQKAAQEMVEKWLPTAWDLSAASASRSQEMAISYMTAECAAAYRQNVWTPDMQQSISSSGLVSKFQYNVIRVIGTKPDGSVVVGVQGEQVLQVPGKLPKARPVNLEYLVKQTAQGLKIAGISEGTDQKPYGS